MFCIECGEKIPDAAKFCPDCGASQIDKGRKKVGLKKLKRSREMPLETESEEETVKAKPKEKRPIEKKELEPYEVEVLNELTEKRKYYAKILLFALIYITIAIVISEVVEKLGGIEFNTVTKGSFYLNPFLFLYVLIRASSAIGILLSQFLLVICLYKTYQIKRVEGFNRLIDKEDAVKKLTEDAKYYAVALSCLLVTGLIAMNFDGNLVFVMCRFFGGVIILLLVHKSVRIYTSELQAVAFTVMLVLFGYALSLEEGDSDSSSSSLPPRGGNVELELRNRDAGYSELSYVVYFDDKEGPSGTLAYNEDIWYTLCGNCEGSHTIEVYWGDGDDCQADIEVVGSSDEIWQCTNNYG